MFFCFENRIFCKLDNNTPRFCLQVFGILSKTMAPVNLRGLYLYFEIGLKNITTTLVGFSYFFSRYAKDNEAIPSRVLVLFVKVVDQIIVLLL